MNTLHKGVTTLLRSAITGEKLPLPEDFRLEDVDELVRSQSLVPMIYQGAYHCGISVDTELMQQYKQLYFRALMRHEQQMREVKRICRAFEENDIDYALLKGCVMKPLYPNPEMRVMGDADILIRKEQYEKIRGVMRELEFTEGSATSWEYHWLSPGLLVELHWRLFALGNFNMLRYFDQVWERTYIQSGSRRALSDEDTYLYIFGHMTKHFQDGGIGARQFVDLEVFRMSHPDMDKEKISIALDKMGLREFYDNTIRLLQTWFADVPPNMQTEIMTDYIFSSKGWGSKKNSVHTKAILSSAGKIQKARGKIVLHSIFPDLAHMQSIYIVLVRCPWLLPLFWVIRWVDIPIRRRENIGIRMNIIKNMSKKTLSERKAFLDAVGLNFYEK